jgi:hypothetical protein
MKPFYVLAIAALFMAAPIRLSAAPDAALDQKCRGYARMQICTLNAYKTGKPCMEPKAAYAKCVAARGNV